MTDLNEYALGQILMRLQGDDLARVCAVNKHLNQLASEDSLWKRHCWDLVSPVWTIFQFPDKNPNEKYKQFYYKMIDHIQKYRKLLIETFPLDILSSCMIKNVKLMAKCWQLDILAQQFFEKFGRSNHRCILDSFLCRITDSELDTVLKKLSRGHVLYLNGQPVTIPAPSVVQIADNEMVNTNQLFKQLSQLLYRKWPDSFFQTHNHAEVPIRNSWCILLAAEFLEYTLKDLFYKNSLFLHQIPDVLKQTLQNLDPGTCSYETSANEMCTRILGQLEGCFKKALHTLNIHPRKVVFSTSIKSFMINIWKDTSSVPNIERPMRPSKFNCYYLERLRMKISTEVLDNVEKYLFSDENGPSKGRASSLNFPCDGSSQRTGFKFYSWKLNKESMFVSIFNHGEVTALIFEMKR